MKAVLSFVAIVALLSLPAMAAEEEKECWACHATSTPGIVEQWKSSKHFDADIGCVECNGADKTDPDAFEHYG